MKKKYEVWSSILVEDSLDEQEVAIKTLTKKEKKEVKAVFDQSNPVWENTCFFQWKNSIIHNSPMYLFRDVALLAAKGLLENRGKKISILGEEWCEPIGCGKITHKPWSFLAVTEFKEQFLTQFKDTYSELQNVDAKDATPVMMFLVVAWQIYKGLKKDEEMSKNVKFEWTFNEAFSGKISADSINIDWYHYKYVSISLTGGFIQSILENHDDWFSRKQKSQVTWLIGLTDKPESKAETPVGDKVIRVHPKLLEVNAYVLELERQICIVTENCNKMEAENKRCKKELEEKKRAHEEKSFIKL